MERMFASIGLLVMVGCAPAAPAVQPSSEVPYQSWSCQQLADEQLRLQVALTAAYERQGKGSSEDVAGMIAFGMPESSWSGQNNAPDIARYKGQQETVRNVAMQKKCPSPMPRSG